MDMLLAKINYKILESHKTALDQIWDYSENKETTEEAQSDFLKILTQIIIKVEYSDMFHKNSNVG